MEKRGREKRKETISPVVLLCAADGFGKVREKLTTRKMSSSRGSLSVLSSFLSVVFL